MRVMPRNAALPEADQGRDGKFHDERELHRQTGRLMKKSEKPAEPADENQRAE